MTAQDIKILGVTVTYNNEDKIPYVMPYYERIGIDKLIVYDNGSTDKTVEMLSQYPFVEIRSYITDHYEEGTILKYKTEVQNEFKGQYHWCISTYFDEVFYSDRDFREVLYDKMCKGQTYFLKTGLNIFSRHFPPTDNGKLIHENVGCGSLWTSDDKIMGVYGNKVELFDMAKVFVKYHMGGCHECQIRGLDSPFEDDICFFHLKFIDYDFIVKSNAEYVERTKGTDIICYDYFAKNMEKVYQLMEKRAISIDEYKNTPMNKLMPQQVVFLIKETDKEKQKAYIDRINECSEHSIVQQYSILFYGLDVDDIYEVWKYGRDKGINVNNHTKTENAISAVKGFSYTFGTTLKPEPWIAKIDNIDILNFDFFDTFEKVLRETTDRMLSIDGVWFVKEKRFITGIAPATLGCYMIVKNEEKTIKNCLDSIIDFCDEIVVVDTGCSDKTMDIVKSYGDKIKIYNFTWINDFSAARNFAMSKLNTEYVFTTDADEIFSPNLRKTITDLKDKRFNNLDCVDIKLLNYNGTDFLSYYTGGRQIVRNLPENIWKYRVHEKLYFRRNTHTTIETNDGYILHMHQNNESSHSNYNKYAEWYYKDLNGSEEELLSSNNGAHYFYYLFYTLKGMDHLRAKEHLNELYKPERIQSYTEYQRANMYEGNYISFEEWFAFELLNCHPWDYTYLYRAANLLKEELPKYLILHHVYRYSGGAEFDSVAWINLSYISYRLGLIDEFIETTEKAFLIYPYNSTIKYNHDFIENTLKNVYEKTVTIFSSSGTFIESAKNYFTHMFKNVKVVNKEDDIDGNYVIDMDKVGQLDRQRAIDEYQNILFGRGSNIIEKIGRQ